MTAIDLKSDTNDSPGALGSSEVAENGATATRETRAPSPSLAWAITIGEATLWGTLTWFFADYWLMLPVRYRWAGILVLASLATIGIIRLVRFHWRSSQKNKADMETRAAEHDST